LNDLNNSIISLGEKRVTLDNAFAFFITLTISFLLSFVALIYAQKCSSSPDCGPFPLKINGGPFTNTYPGMPLIHWVDLPALSGNLSFVLDVTVNFIGDESVCYSANLAEFGTSQCFPSNGGNLSITWTQGLPNDNDGSNVEKGRMLINIWCHIPKQCAAFTYTLNAGLVHLSDSFDTATHQHKKLGKRENQECCSASGGALPSPCCSWGTCKGIPKCGPSYPGCTICCPAAKASVCVYPGQCRCQ